MIQISLKKHSFYNSNWSCFEHTVACANREYTCNHAVLCYILCLCKVIEKSVMAESFFPVLRDSILDSILDSRWNRESRFATDYQLTFERYCKFTPDLSTVAQPIQRQECGVQMAVRTTGGI